MDVRESEITFHGRKVVQADEIFFVDSQMGTTATGTYWITDQRRSLVHDGCIYNRLDSTPEFYQFIHPEFVPPKAGTPVQILHEDGRVEESVLLDAEPSCQHAA